jgi:iron complex transport system ATP-binding protein
LPLLEVSNLGAGYNGHRVLSHVNLEVKAGERWAVIGRNGTGKSTLIRTIAGLLIPSSGSVQIKDNLVQTYKARERAQQLAYVPQKPEAVIPYSVQDFVMLGRYCTMGLFGLPDRDDLEAVSQAMQLCNVSHLRERLMTTLSGGELQRVLLAGALAQDAPLLLLDEPTTFLDPAHERLFFRALESAQSQRELTIIMVTHDINTALHACTHILALLEGQVNYNGAAALFKNQCPDILKILYGISFESYTGTKGETLIYGTWGEQA